MKIALLPAVMLCLLAPDLPAEEQEQPAAETTVRVKIETTLGAIILELDAAKAPITVHNFLRYVTEKYYDGTIFHRVRPEFMIQGGGLTPDMEKKTAGQHPPIYNEWENGLKNLQGTIAMARTGQPHSATSQFFINVVDNPNLDRPTGGAAYAVFGEVVEGVEAVDNIRYTETHTHPKLRMGKVVPVAPVVINSVRIIGECDLDKLAARAQEAQEKFKSAEAEQAKALEEFKAKYEEAQAKGTKTESGLVYMDVTVGEGASPEPTGMVQVHCTGMLPDGTKFYSSYDGRGTPLRKQATSFVPGFNEGISTMKVGGKRILIIPGELGYGERGQPRAKIPPNATLVFEVELLGVE